MLELHPELSYRKDSSGPSALILCSCGPVHCANLLAKSSPGLCHCVRERSCSLSAVSTTVQRPWGAGAAVLVPTQLCFVLLQASTSTSDGMLTLDLIQEEDASPEDHGTCEESFRVDLDKSVAHLTAGRRRSDSENTKASEKGRTGSLPRQEVTSWDRAGQCSDSFDKGTMYTPQVPKKLSHSEKNKCASMEEILSRRDSSAHRAVLRKGLEAQFASAEPEQLSRIQELVALKLEKTQELLTEVKGYGEGKRKTKDSNTSTTITTTSSSSSSSKSDSERILQESERLLGEASSTWSQAKRVLQEIKELRDLYKQFELQQSDSKPKQSSQSQFRKSMM